ncbi:MAG: hypothetical protein O7G88_20625 [bacterium]|nr:hypothetical protein [bacterium]
MQDVLSQLIDDFHERDLPALLPRDRRVPQVPGKAQAIIGMRRVGKTWFCYQRMQELLTQGLVKKRPRSHILAKWHDTDTPIVSYRLPLSGGCNWEN